MVQLCQSMVKEIRICDWPASSTEGRFVLRLEIITTVIKHLDTSNFQFLPVINPMTVCALNYVTSRISIMLTVTSFGLVFLLCLNPVYLF